MYREVSLAFRLFVGGLLFIALGLWLAIVLITAFGGPHG